MSEEPKSNDSSEIIAQALDELKQELGEKFSIETINLAELERRTGITRARLRKYKANGFKPTPHGNTGRKATVTVLSRYSGVIDDLLRHSVSNSEVIYERIRELGYSGGKSQLKAYISAHKDLIPPPNVSLLLLRAAVDRDT